METKPDENVGGDLLCRCEKTWLAAQDVCRHRRPAALTVVLASCILYVGWFVRGKPSIRIDYVALLNQMSRPQVAETDNAWPYYERAIALFISPNSELQAIPALERPDYAEHREFADLSDNAQHAHDRPMDRGQPRRLGGLVGGRFPNPGGLHGHRPCRTTADGAFPALPATCRPWRFLPRVGLWLSRRHISQGRTTEALEDCLTVARRR